MHPTIDPPFERSPQEKLGRAFSDVVLHKAAPLQSSQRDSGLCSSISQPNEDLSHGNSADSFRLSISSGISTSSLESLQEIFL
ncbi:hypothetical protein OROHE_011056 [Orobanche hederae]